MQIRIDGVSQNTYRMLLAALNWFKPRADEDFFASADCRKVFRSFTKSTESAPSEELAFASGDKIAMTFEGSSFRFLERAFKSARESGEVYFAAAAEYVVEAMGVVKRAVEIEPEKPAEKPKG